MTAELTTKLKEAADWLKLELGQFSTGRANPAMLDGVQVDSYGTKQPIRSVASINTEDARTLRIGPWDKSQIKAIEQAIVDAKLPVSVSTDDQGLRVHVPALTEESRTAIVKNLKEKLEQARVRVRAAREDAIKALQAEDPTEDELRSGKEEIQEQVDATNDTLQEIFAKKESEVMTI